MPALTLKRQIFPATDKWHNVRLAKVSVKYTFWELFIKKLFEGQLKGQSIDVNTSNLTFSKKVWIRPLLSRPCFKIDILKRLTKLAKMTKLMFIKRLGSSTILKALLQSWHFGKIDKIDTIGQIHKKNSKLTKLAKLAKLTFSQKVWSRLLCRGALQLFKQRCLLLKAKVLLWNFYS